jgi:hypothetical protein
METKMKKAISKILIIGLVLFSLSQPELTADAQSYSDIVNAYKLGVNLGFASFQLQAGEPAFGYARDALTLAKTAAESLKHNVPQLNPTTLEKITSQFTYGASANWGKVISDTIPVIVNLRGEYSGVLQQASKPLGAAYELGLDLSIAEAQATVGEPARGIVRSSLQNALSPAQGLGLPASELNGIIQQIDQGAPLDGIYGQITSLRGKYLGFCLAYKPVGSNTQPQVSFDALLAPDRDLANRGCRRNGVGYYACPTLIGYEACEVYRKSGKAKACSTTAEVVKQQAMDKDLFSVGCNRFLGRPDEFVCKTKKAVVACEAYRQKGQAKKCLLITQ